MTNYEQAETETVAGCEFTKGLLAGHEVILLQSGIGKVNAAMSTTILLEKYKPEKVLILVLLVDSITL